jgi:hypothetical protein
MTRNYNRSLILSYFELKEEQQIEVLTDFCFERSNAEQDSYIISEFKGEKTAVPLSLFMRTDNNNFTHGIFSDSYFSGYFITLSRCNTEAVIAYKYF